MWFLLKMLGLDFNKFMFWAATATWKEHYGAASSFASGIANLNWKYVESPASAYGTYPIPAGKNSFVRWSFIEFTGTYNKLLNGLFAHTATAFGASLSLWGPQSPATAPLTYTAPASAAHASMTTDMTTAIAIGSGIPVYFGPSGPGVTGGLIASYATNPAFTNYLTTQLRASEGAAAGDTATVTITVQYDEN